MALIPHDKIIEILKLVAESKIDELHVETGDLKLIMKKYGQAASIQAAESSSGRVAKPKDTGETSLHTTGDPLEGGRSPIPQPKVQSPQPVPMEEQGFLAIKAPMLGTFYRRPKPDVPPFVELGQLVTEENVVCIIEVMKLFNMVRAGVKGRIAKICAENAQMVEYNQVLFWVEKVEES